MAIFTHGMYLGLSAHRASRGPERSSARGSAAAVLLSIYEKLAGKDIDRTN